MIKILIAEIQRYEQDHHRGTQQIKNDFLKGKYVFDAEDYYYQVCEEIDEKSIVDDDFDLFLNAAEKSNDLVVHKKHGSLLSLESLQIGFLT